MCLIVGIAVVICLSLLFHQRFSRQPSVVQKDTVEVVKTIRYYAPDIETVQLDVPDVRIPEFIFILEEEIRIEYRDSVRYVALPREYYYSKIDEVEVWHSGIESRIDSLRFTQKNSIIRETTQDSPFRHTLTAYGELGYLEGLKATAGVKYLYHPNRWLGVGGSIERDFLARQTGIFANIDMTLSW